MEAIDIITDIPHATRKIVPFQMLLRSEFVAIQTVSKKDDTCSQRHELIGVKNIHKE